MFSRSAAAWVLTPVTGRTLPVELVQSLFDLTPTEARVARGLASGETVKDIAAAAGVSPNTIRTHVRGVPAGVNGPYSLVLGAEVSFGVEL